jgi:integrase
MSQRKRHGDGIYKRGTTWWATWTENGETQRKSLGVKDRKVALRLPAVAAAKKSTLGDAIDAMVDDLRRAGRPAGTIRMYESKAKNITKFFGRDCRLAELASPSRIESYFRKRADEDGAHVNTLQKEWAVLSRVLKRAKRHKVFAIGDVGELRPEWVQANYEPRETFLTWDQIPRLLNELEASKRGVVAFIIATGARWTEAMRFQPEDLDRTSWQVRMRGSKTKASAKTIGIPEHMRGLLDHVSGPFEKWPGVNLSLARACRRAQLKLAADVAAAFDASPSHEREGWCTPLFPRVTPNDLRRTFSSLLVQGGAPLEVVAKLMRHTSTAMVYRVYGQHTPESLARLASGGKESVALAAVPPVYQTQRTPEDSADSLDSGEAYFSEGAGFRRRDSNPDKRIQNPLSCH